MKEVFGHCSPRAFLAFALALLALAVAAPAAQADDTIHVNTTQDSTGGSCSASGGICSLREAVELVNEGEGEAEGEGVSGRVTIDIESEGTLPITHGELELDPGDGVTSVAIFGRGAGKVTIDGEESSRIFFLSLEEEQVSLSDLTLAGGKLTGSEFFQHGGAAILQEGGEVVLESVRVTENSVESSRNGGAVYLDSGSLAATDSKFDHNQAEEGAGGAIFTESEDADALEIHGSEFVENHSGSAGGAVSAGGSLAVVVESTFRGNTTNGLGAGLVLGGEEGENRVVASEFVENHAGLRGGAISAIGPEAESLIVESTLSKNEANGGGGGIYALSELTIERSTLSDNRVPVKIGQPVQEEAGGGILGNEGPVFVVDSTIAYNYGGGIAMTNGPMTVRGSTIAGNAEPGKKAGGIEAESAVTVTSSILAYNTSGEGSPSCSGTIVSGGHNIVSNANSCVWPPAAEDRLNVDPQLGELQDNGGPTQTMAPTLISSPAINHGSEPTTIDQRGLTRPVPNAPEFTDVGAVEIQAPVSILSDPPKIVPDTELAAGDTVTCEHGGWETDGITDPTYSYTWLRDGSQVATGATYELTNADAEAEIECEVGADNGATVTLSDSAAVELMPASASLTPSPLDFGKRNLTAGVSDPEPLTLSNDGGVTITVGEATSTDPIEFPLDGSDCVSATLAPGQSCVVQARFAPAATGARIASAEVPTSAGNVAAGLEGTGTEAAFEASPTEADLGARLVGAGPGAPQVFTVTNRGSGELPIGTVALVGVDADEFTLPAGEDHCSNVTLEPGAQCQVSVAFAPQATGLKTAALEFPGEVPGSVDLKGEGVAPLFSVSPASHDFGDRRVDSGPSSAQAFTVENQGSGEMTIGTVSIEGAADFALSGEDECSGETLQPAETCSVEVAFDPQQAGSRGATLRFPGSAPGSAGLEGFGTEPAFLATPEAWDFGAVDIDGGAVSKAVVVENGGDATMTIGAVRVAGPAADQFAIGGSGPGCEGASLEPGGTCTVTALFDPSQVGAAAAELTLAGDAPGTVALAGTGVEPAPVAPPSVSLVPPAGGRLTADGDGQVRLSVRCESPTGSPCQTAVGVQPGLGRWSGSVAAGAVRSLAVRLSKAGRERLGAKLRLAAQVVIATEGGATESTSVRLSAPRPPVLTPRAARRDGEALLLNLSCAGYQRNCRGRVVVAGAGRRAPLASGLLTVPAAGGERRLHLTAAGQKLEQGAHPTLTVRVVTLDPLYRRQTSRTTHLRLS